MQVLNGVVPMSSPCAELEAPEKDAQLPPTRTYRGPCTLLQGFVEAIARILKWGKESTNRNIMKHQLNFND